MTTRENRVLMHTISLASATDFHGWRTAARTLVLGNVAPADITWRVKNDEPELFEPQNMPPPEARGTFNVPAAFVDLAKSAILHSDPQRFALLYRVLWRLRAHHDLMQVATDPDVARLYALSKAVRRDEHKMHAFVR